MVKSSDKKIIAALETAAREGSLSAAFILGRLHDEGWGITENARTAADWYEVAASGGLPEAYYFVASAYWAGNGRARDTATAYRWFRRAAEAGDLTAAYMEALCLVEGSGVEPNSTLGIKLMTRVAKRGSEHAMDYLAAHYGAHGQLRKARSWAVRAVKAGDLASQLRIEEFDRQSKRKRTRTKEPGT